MKTAIIGDLHIGSRGGDPRVRSFITSYIADYLFPKFESLGVTSYIQTGDAFDVRKHLHGLDMEFVMDVFVPLHEIHNLKGYFLTGNHDITLRDSNRVSWVAFLERVGEGFIKSFREAADIEINGTNFLMLPWINKNNYENSLRAIHNSKSDFAVAHLELAGFPMYRNSFSEEGQVELETLSKFKKVLSGHYHTISGEDSGNVLYVGTPYHLNWLDYGDKRGFWVFDHETQELEFFENLPELSMFEVFEYDWKKIEADPNVKLRLKTSKDLETTFGFKGKIVRVVVIDRGDDKHYADFCAALRAADVIDYTIVDKTVTYQTKVDPETGETVSGDATEISEEILNADIIDVLKRRVVSSNLPNPQGAVKMVDSIWESATSKEKL